MPPPARRTLHYTELPDLPPDSPLHREWAYFRRQLPSWLAEGRAGQFALVKGDILVGFYPSFEDGLQASYERVGIVPFLLHEIRSEEPLLLLPWCCLPCPT